MNNMYREFSLKLREERIRCGLTQRRICEHTGMRQSSFSRTETGYIRLTYPKLKNSCKSGIGIFYTFTGNRAPDFVHFLKPSNAAPEKLLYLLNIISIHADAAGSRNRIFPGNFSETSLVLIRKQLDYLHFLSVNAYPDQNIFYCLWNHLGYTQREIADLFGMDIKTLRNLEKGLRRRTVRSYGKCTSNSTYHLPLS